MDRAGLQPDHPTPSAEAAAPRATRAVGYLRRSTDRQEQSIGDQKAAVERCCAERGLSLLRCYVDDAISGTSTIGRRAFQRLIADAQSPGCDFGVVVCYDVKRFGRLGNDEAGYYRHLLRTSGVEVVYAGENFAGDYTDDLLRPVKQWQARQESKDLSKVTIRGLLTKSASGHWMGGAPPYGYDLRYESQSGQFLFHLRYLADGTKIMFDRRWRPVRTLARGESVAVSRRDHCTLVAGDPGRVDTVRRIFRMYAAGGHGLKAITDALNREKVPPARGPKWAGHYSGQWAFTTVRAILINPAYRGDMVWNRSTDARFHRVRGRAAVERGDLSERRLERNPRSDWCVVRGAHAALVDRRTWQLAQERLGPGRAAGAEPRSELRRVGDAVGPRSRFLLSGLVRCARCGSRYEGYTQRSGAGSPRLYHYACGGYIRRGKSVCSLGALRQEVVERAVVTAITGYYARAGAPRIAGEVRRLAASDTGDLGAALATARARVEDTDRAIRGLLDRVSPATRAAVERRVGELDAQREQLHQRIESLRAMSWSAASVRAAVRDVGVFLERLPDQLETGPLPRRQAALRACLAEATVHYPGRLVLRVRRVPAVSGLPAPGLAAVRVALRRPERRRDGPPDSDPVRDKGPVTGNPRETAGIPLPCARLGGFMDPMPPAENGPRQGEDAMPKNPRQKSSTQAPAKAGRAAEGGRPDKPAARGKPARPAPDGADVPVRRAVRGRKARTPKPANRGGCLEAAAAVLAESKAPLGCKELVERMLAKGLWQTGGKTPAATVYAAIVREIAGKGRASRFKKTERGMFAAA